MTAPMPGCEPAPRFSIVTIVRNDRAGLEATRASIAAQDYGDREWIVIDAASTDTTRDLVMALLSDGEAGGLSEPDKGIYDGMNKGLALARGDYVMFLNAGDCLQDAGSLGMADAALRGAGDPDIGFFGSIMDFGSRRIVRPVKPPSYVWHGQPGLHQATLVRTGLHKAYPFSLEYRMCGDFDALARMSKSGAKMHSFPGILGANEFNSTSYSGRFKMQLLREALDIQRKVLHLPWWLRAISLTRRAVNSMVAKLLTSLETRRQ